MDLRLKRLLITKNMVPFLYFEISSVWRIVCLFLYCYHSCVNFLMRHTKRLKLWKLWKCWTFYAPPILSKLTWMRNKTFCLHAINFWDYLATEWLKVRFGRNFDKILLPATVLWYSMWPHCLYISPISPLCLVPTCGEEINICSLQVGHCWIYWQTFIVTPKSLLLFPVHASTLCSAILVVGHNITAV